jgi:hypothetical protein
MVIEEDKNLPSALQLERTELNSAYDSGPGDTNLVVSNEKLYTILLTTKFKYLVHLILTQYSYSQQGHR